MPELLGELDRVHERAAGAHAQSVDVRRLEPGVVECRAHDARLERAERQVDLAGGRHLVGGADDGDCAAQRVAHRGICPDEQLAQLGLAHLHRRGAWERVDDADLGRHLVARESLSHVVLQFLFRHRRPFAQLDGCDRYCAEPFVVDTGHAGVTHGWVRAQYVDDLAGEDLEATTHDGVVAAAVDPEEAVVVDAGNVGRADPVGVAPAHLESPGSAGWQLGAGVRIDHAQLATRLRTPHAATLALGPLPVERECPARDAAGELGGTVRRKYGDAVLRLERLLHRHRKRGAP